MQNKICKMLKCYNNLNMVDDSLFGTSNWRSWNKAMTFAMFTEDFSIK